MNKNLKKVIAITLALSAIATVGPTKSYNFLTTAAYAKSSDADELDSITLQDNNDDDITLYSDSDYDDEVDDGDLDVGKTYYAESSTKKITIDSVDGASKKKVRIFKGSSDKAYEIGDKISLDDGTTTLKVRVYEDSYDEDETYSSSDYNQYTIKVSYDEDDDDEDDDDDSDNDEDTLDSLELLNSDGDNIKLYEDKNYDDKVSSDDVEEGDTYYAKTSSDEVSVETEGPDEDYIKIFKSTSSSAKGVDPGDDISISGTKTLTIRIYSEEPDSDIEYGDDDDVIGEYKIKVEYTGNDDSDDTDDEDTTSSSSSSSTTGTATSKPSTSTDNIVTERNKWVQNNGYWQYKDAAGSLVKSSWVGNYFLDSNGNMATNWLSNNGSWYYLGSDGAKKTGWQSVSGKWYYLDSQGIMQTGWLRDFNGKWYYLNTDGSMASNTTIDGYKLGTDGAWITK